MDYTLKKSYTNTANLTAALDTNNYINADYLCENPWSVEGIETVPGIEIDKDSLSEIISRVVGEAFKEKNLLVTPKIEKYHIKHR